MKPSYHELHGPLTLRSGAIEFYIQGHRVSEDDYYRYVDTLTGEVFVPPGRLTGPKHAIYGIRSNFEEQ